MTDEPQDTPKSIIARLKSAWRRWRMEARERRALRDVLAKPGDHWLEDAGITRDEALRILERRRLHGIAERIRQRGGGL